MCQTSMGKHNPQKTSSVNAGIQHRVVTIYLLYEIANKITFFSFPIIPHGSSGRFGLTSSTAPLEHLIILFSKTASLLLPYEPSTAHDQPSPNRQRSQSLAGSTVNSNFNIANMMVPRPQSYLSPCDAAHLDGDYDQSFLGFVDGR